MQQLVDDDICGKSTNIARLRRCLGGLTMMLMMRRFMLTWQHWWQKTAAKSGNMTLATVAGGLLPLQHVNMRWSTISFERGVNHTPFGLKGFVVWLPVVWRGGEELYICVYVCEHEVALFRYYFCYYFYQYLCVYLLFLLPVGALENGRHKHILITQCCCMPL